MPRPSLRLVPPGSLIEITTRISGGLPFLQSSPELDQRITAILGRALALHPVALHAYAFLPDHWRALITTGDGDQLSAFIRHVNGNVARAVGESQRWFGRIWHKRRMVAVDDDVACLRSLLSAEAGCRRILDDPGLSSSRALALGDDPVGMWHDRDRERRSPQQRPVPQRELLRPYPVTLTALPSWAAWQPEQRQLAVRCLIGAIESRGGAVAGGDVLWHPRGDRSDPGASSAPGSALGSKETAWRPTSN